MQAQTDVNAGSPQKYTARSDRNVKDEPKIRGDASPVVPWVKIERTHVTSPTVSACCKWYVRKGPNDPR